MDFLKENKSTIGTVLSAGGSLQQAATSFAAGEAAYAAGKASAAQLRQNAGQAQAVGQRKAADASLQARLLMSRAQAVAAASGGGALDPTVLNIIGGIAYEGKMSADNEIYTGNDQARMLKDQANMAVYEGKLKRAAGDAGGMGGFLSAGSTLLALV